MTTVRLHDGNTIDVDVHGSGPTVLLPVDPVPVEGARAEELRRWGTDPALGRRLVDGLADAYRVVAFDYEGHVLAVPKPESLTPANLAADFLAVADAVGAARFVFYGYSWLAVAGLQLAVRTPRLAALAVGGWPPLGAPYAEMLRVTSATHAMTLEAPAPAPGGDETDWSTVQVTLSPAQTRQFVTLYEGLRDFDETATPLTMPRLCFAGSADATDYEQRWGGVHIDLAGPLVRRRAELEALGWRVRVLDGLDHTGAMQAAAVLPVLRPWLDDLRTVLTGHPRY